MGVNHLAPDSLLAFQVPQLLSPPHSPPCSFCSRHCLVIAVFLIHQPVPTSRLLRSFLCLFLQSLACYMTHSAYQQLTFYYIFIFPTMVSTRARTLIHMASQCLEKYVHLQGYLLNKWTFQWHWYNEWYKATTRCTSVTGMLHWHNVYKHCINCPKRLSRL